MDPDRWGEHMLDSMEAGLQCFLDRLPEEVRADYEDAYIGKYKEWLYAMSRCFSAMVTGSAGFNNRRHEKANAAEHAARKRLDEWVEKVVKRCNRQERLTGWAEVERLQEKIDNLRRSHAMMKEANVIVRKKNVPDVEKIDELMALGFSEDAANKVLYPEYDFQKPGFGSYQLSYVLRDIKEAEEKMRRHETMANKEDETHEYPWGTLVVCYQDERYRFLFDGKPSVDVINLMKANAFKWSRANMAWQRQITVNAKYAVKQIIEELNKAA